MSNCLRLGRLAIAADGEANEFSFTLKGKTWQIVEQLQADFEGIKTLLEWASELDLERKRFVLFEERLRDGRLSLEVYYNQKFVLKHQKSDECKLFMAQILSVLYKNYKEDISYGQPSSESGELIKTYVTRSLYDHLYEKHQHDKLGDTLLKLPKCFRPTLCEYQKRTVRWLLKKEVDRVVQSPLYHRLEAKSEELSIYKHMYCLDIQEEMPQSIELPPGGILADEMGLGKTVEVVALMLLNQRKKVRAPDFLNDHWVGKKRKVATDNIFCTCISKSKRDLVQCTKCMLRQHQKCVLKFNNDHPKEVNDPYLCPQCWNDELIASDSLVETAATFIVSPNTIRTQWLREMTTHIVPNLRVLMYDGISTGWISPRQMANYDVVLTDYTVLRSEVHHTNDNLSDRKTRNDPKSLRLRSPLMMLHWWRVCLDEAQMIESNASKVAALVKRLPAINRWAVTGTPIQKSINDLQPLLEFVGYDHIASTYNVWANLTHDFIMRHGATQPENAVSALPLVDVLQLCMWRTSKSTVVDELFIPPQTEVVHHIDLSDIEKLFYMEQHNECREKFYHNIDKYLQRSQRIRTISPTTLNFILQPLLKMRQCCSISVVSVGSSANTGVGQKLFLQPKELNRHLITTNETDCKTELRSIVSCYNGLAGIHFLRQEYEAAIEKYKHVLGLSTAYKDVNITVDSLLQIHALHNLLEALKFTDTAGIEPSQMQQYEDAYNALEWKYLEPYATVLTTARLAAEEVEKNIAATQSNPENNTVSLAAEILDILGISERADVYENQLMNKIHDEFGDTFGPKISQMQSLRTVLYIISKWHNKFTKLQQDFLAKFRELKLFVENVRTRKEVPVRVWREMRQFINSVYDCHLYSIRDLATADADDQAEQKQKNTCQLCVIKADLQNLECLVFAKVLDERTNQMEGVSSPSLEILLLKLILNFVKSKPEFLGFAEQIDKQFEIMEDMQQLYKKFSKYWIEIEYTVKAYDELDMCKMRLALCDDNKTENKSHYEIYKHEIPDIFAEHSLLLPSVQQQFTTKYRRLRYVKHLETNTEELICPICQTKIEQRYTVLECGHSLCWSCLHDVRTHSGGHGSMTCAICRHKQSTKTIYYAVNMPCDDEDSMSLVGNFSSKIAYIVRLILKLSKSHCVDDGPLKILIFSQWKEILNAIASGLKTKDISYRLQTSLKSIDEFKTMDITCLLMPLARGSKGLNLIEATHVFLVEPILNPAEELQAIGRVHRFGQTRPTTVHRFIMKNTIEENIYKIISKGKNSQDNWDFENTTVEDLSNFFVLENTVAEWHEN